jgi:signal transduction histidine kinase
VIALVLPAPSVRRRLIAVAVLAIVACAFAGYALLHFRQTTLEQRRVREREVVAHEVDRLGRMLESEPNPETRRRGLRGVGLMRSGFLDAELRDEGNNPGFAEGIRAERAEAAKLSGASHATVLRDAKRIDGTPVVVAVLALPQGGYAWAVSYLPPGAKGLRTSVLVLSVATLLLVVASLHTLLLFQRGVSSIRGSLATLALSRTAKVERPRFAELGEIAGGIETLARELAHKERLAALGKVVAGVAHEVRNPLTAMKLRVDLALAARKDADPSLARDFTVISEEIARLERFVSDLLSAAGQKTAAPTRVSLGELVRRRAELLLEWARERGARIDVEGDATASVDADAFARLVDNLLRNAVEASPPGGVVLAEIALQGDGCAITIDDAGAGIPEARVDEIFEPFFTTKPSGVGLGLAISRAIAIAHGGTLTYVRAHDRTRFTLTLPRGVSPGEAGG